MFILKTTMYIDSLYVTENFCFINNHSFLKYNTEPQSCVTLEQRVPLALTLGAQRRKSYKVFFRKEMRTINTIA